MQIFFLIPLIFGLFIYLLCLFLLGRDDFVILRKNISMEQIFNVAFISAFVGLFVARVFYVVFNFDQRFLHPFAFFLFPYFPGLSLAGGVLGGTAFVLGYCIVRKLPARRLFDIFSLSFFCTLPFGFLANFLTLIFAKKNFVYLNLIILVLFLGLFVFLVKVFLLGKLKDGSVGLLSLLSFSAVFLIANITGKGRISFEFSLENIILTLLFLISLLLFVKQEKIVKMRRTRRA